MIRLNRRSFLKSSMGVAGGMFALDGAPSFGNVLGANERIRVAVAGINGRGKSHMDEFARMKDQGVEVAYLIDPDTRIFEQSIKRVEEIAGYRPQAVQDVRTVLDDPSVDAISIATPNHWHSLMTIWACQAGKDVYVEKPCSHNVHEGRIAVDAARRFKRIVQHGTQNRSSRGWAKTVAVVQSGHYGKLKVAHGYCHKPRGSIGFKPTGPVPEGLDFNLWLGPAPDQPYHGNLVHYNWHWFWDTGNGDVGNQGVHQMDVARWGIQNATLPTSVVSLGGRFGYEDQGQTPNTQLTVFDYGETQLIFQVRGLTTPRKITNTFVLEEGRIDDGKFYANGSSNPEPLPDLDFDLGPGNGPFENFIAAVRSREVRDLNADILEGHYSSALCHLGNVSYRLGDEVPFNSKTKTFADNPAASETFEKIEEHLAKENGLKLESMNYQLGRHLSFDAESERFVNDEQANQLLTRDYREPFVVPDRIA